MAKKDDKMLKPTEELFCQYYIKGGSDFRLGNGTRSYAAAYDKQLPKDENLCATKAYLLIRKDKIKKRCRQILQESGHNDEAVDAKLNEHIFGENDMVSIKAIQEYNKIASRVDDSPHISIPVAANIIIKKPENVQTKDKKKAKGA